MTSSRNEQDPPERAELIARIRLMLARLQAQPFVPPDLSGEELAALWRELQPADQEALFRTFLAAGLDPPLRMVAPVPDDELAAWPPASALDGKDD